MSWRHPARNNSSASASNTMRNCAGRLMRHLRDIGWMIAFKEFSCFCHAEPGVLRFNTKKKLVPAAGGEAGNVEHRMIWLRQAVQGQHAKHRGQRSAQHGAFKRHRDKGRPGV